MKKVIIAVIVIVIVVVIAGNYIWVKNNKADLQSEQTNVTSDQAIEKVKALPEVKAWLAKIDTKNETPKFTAVSDGEYYDVIVNKEVKGEIVPFYTYFVDVRTGEVAFNEEVQ